MAILVETVPRTRPATRSRARGRGGVGSRGARRDDALGVRGRRRSRVDVGPARFNQLGLGADPNVPANVAFLATPRRVPGVGRVTSLAAGGNFTVAVAAEGVVSWGANGNGELGSGARADGKSDRPRTAIQPPRDARVTSVAAGWRHAVCVAEDGRAFAWGWGGSAGQHGDDAYTTGGQLGVGDGQVDHWEPTAVVGLGGAARAVRASCGFNHTVVVVEMGEERRA